MRVCFGTLCFSSRLNNSAADEEAPQVQGANPHALIVTAANHVSKMDHLEELQALVTQKNEEIERLTRQLQEIDRELLREAKLRELQSTLQQRDTEILNLRSQLDKFQSVFKMHNPTSPKSVVLNNRLRPRKQRAGISAEPQSETSIMELSKQTFETHPKDER